MSKADRNRNRRRTREQAKLFKSEIDGGYNKMADTGFIQETPQLGEIKDPGYGIHLWVMIMSYRVLNPAKLLEDKTNQIFDVESLIEINGPGCRKCEMLWSPELEKKLCRGDLKEYVDHG